MGRPFSFPGDDPVVHASALKWPSAVFLLAALCACSGEKRASTPTRIGLPEEAVPQLEKAPPFAGGAWSFTPLRPASREAELQILLFASGSPAFAAMVLPAPRVPFLENWAEKIPAARGAARSDLAASLFSETGWRALPLEVSVPVLLYRNDLWVKNGLPAPKDSAALQEALDSLSRTDRRTEGHLGTTLPMEALFWSLSWSGEGGFSKDLYTAEKVRILRWLVELEGAAKKRGAGSPVLDFQEGHSSALVTDPRTARETLRTFAASGRADACVAVSLPGPGEARSPNLGWCLVRARSPQEKPGAWDDWTGEAYCRWARSTGFQPAFGDGAPQDEVGRIVAGTALCPDLLPGLLIVIAEDAMDDAATGAATAEESLRRAQARWQGQRP